MPFEGRHYRILGDTGIEVSPIGLGTVKLGRNTGVKYPSGFDLPTDTEARELLSCARSLGINLIDTAPAYGSSEVRLGDLLAGQRDDWVICTKVGESYTDGTSSWDFSPKATRESVASSLARLRTDHLDIVLVHSDGDDVDVIRNSGVVETLRDLKRRGDIRAIGVSTKTIEGGLLALEHTDLVMVEFSAANQSQHAVLERAHQLGKGVLVKKALESGHATDPGDALRFVAARQGVSSIIIGTINPAHLITNVEGLLED